MRAAVAVVLLTVLAAGCGGGGLSREEFVDKANANCAERLEAERDVYARKATVEEYKRVYDAELEKQRKLEPPDEMADDWRRYQQLSRESLDALVELIRDEDPKRRTELELAQSRKATQSRLIARDLGIELCAKQVEL